MTLIDRLRDLVRLSFVEPRRAGVALLALDPPMEARWMAVVAAVLVGTLMAYLLPLVAGQLAEAPPPLAAVGLQLAANLIAAVLMSQVGRAFGGKGRFADALLLVAWLQAMMALVQAVQIVALVVMPPLAGIVLVLAIGLFFWLLVGFVQALHGFANTFLVLGGVLATMLAAAFAISFVLVLLGIQPPGMTDV
jgi:membrane glycosyltransferase